MRKLPEWYYNEFVQTGTDYTDKEEVMSYDRKMQRIRNIGEEVKTMLRLVDPRPDDRVLEIGCGTGEFSIELSRHCREVIALDVSEGMLEYAREKARSRNRNNISFIKGGFLTYEADDELFDAVVSQLALHHLPDFWKFTALKRINSMLKTAGRFYLRDVVFSSGIDDFDELISKLLENIPEDVKDEMASEYILHIKEEFSTFDWVMEGLIERAGFRIEESIYDNGFIASYLCIKEK
ncbi:class I SAM-dependent methyltransferase [Methanolobus zinderi]|uniref:Class I SAM-dependent methyltransferase n=1 Tax=Methanolobus zinderi TaxID=536044 RepID=A0A7D5EEQ1_9EURY|nr:class I SAM-dependent methyltransferase [Methanolobus zinderi]QLC48860.1 class I SAM-dependent methyltransferase [Methanolobus zinderi]